MDNRKPRPTAAKFLVNDPRSLTISTMRFGHIIVNINNGIIIAHKFLSVKST